MGIERAAEQEPVACPHGVDDGACKECYMEQAEQEPVAEHELIDIRCGCCGYMTYHREHMGCIKAAAPVRTKDLTDDEIAQAVGSPLDEVYLADFRAVIAADREKNK